jgi:2-hydroxychromene-2-carboxylate isomerase
MRDPIRFYFDFSSPYGYFAALKIDKLAADFGREVSWYPIMLGAAMKITGSKPLALIPKKGDYVKHDWDRLARFMNIPWKMPEKFPVSTLAASRAFYWLVDKNSVLAKRLALASFDTYFGHGLDITAAETIADIAGPLGIDRDTLLSAVQDQVYKQRLKDETLEAIDAGVFGSPFFIIDNEPFWGADRLWLIKRWLKSGGW